MDHCDTFSNESVFTGFHTAAINMTLLAFAAAAPLLLAACRPPLSQARALSSKPAAQC